jgi:hypothetical protein
MQLRSWESKMSGKAWQAEQLYDSCVVEEVRCKLSSATIATSSSKLLVLR